MTTPNIDQVVGGNIRERREDLGLTQKELVAELEKLGWKIDAPALSRIESGSRSVNVGQLAKLGEALQIAPGNILSGYRRGHHLSITYTEFVTTEGQLDDVLDQYTFWHQALHEDLDEIDHDNPYDVEFANEIREFLKTPMRDRLVELVDDAIERRKSGTTNDDPTILNEALQIARQSRENGDGESYEEAVDRLKRESIARRDEFSPQYSVGKGSILRFGD